MICWVCNSLLNQWAGTSRIALDPNKEEAFGNNATFRLTSALSPSSCYLGFLHGWEVVRHRTVGRGHRQAEEGPVAVLPAALQVRDEEGGPLPCP